MTKLGFEKVQAPTENSQRMFSSKKMTNNSLVSRFTSFVLRFVFTQTSSSRDGKVPREAKVNVYFSIF